MPPEALPAEAVLGPQPASVSSSAAALLLTLAGCGPKTASAGNASGGNAYYASAGNYYASYGNASSGNAG